ncbi:hypothetical protein MRX96_023931 [Rhipicephalus microplus]
MGRKKQRDTPHCESRMTTRPPRRVARARCRSREKKIRLASRYNRQRPGAALFPSQRSRGTPFSDEPVPQTRQSSAPGQRPARNALPGGRGLAVTCLATSRRTCF